MIKYILLSHLKFLKSMGYDVYAVCSRGKWIEDIKREGIKVKIIEITRNLNPFADLHSLIRIYLYFRKEKFHIIHTHTLKAEFLGQIASRLAKVPVSAHTFHGFDFDEDAPLLKRKLFLLIDRIALRYSDVVFSITKKFKEIAAKEKICNPGLIKYVGNGVDVVRFNPERFSEDFILNKKKEFGIDSNKKVIGIVARLTKEKGYLDLFQAFSQVILKFPDAILLVVSPIDSGNKDMIPADVVERYGIKNNVLFLGERTDVDEIYSVMDLFVLPAHHEGLGVAILEASAMQKPVVAGRAGGCLEAVDDGKTGILVQIKNPQKLAESIIYVLENPEIAEKMGKAGREKIVNEFSEELFFGRLKKGYDEIISKKLFYGVQK